MSLFVWTPEMSTDVKEIDDQHIELFEHVNAFVEKLRSGSGREEVVPMLDFLESYARKHFAYEERCMMKHRCPAACANKDAHKQFLATVASIRKTVEAGPIGAVVALRMQREVCDWIRAHIIRIDSRLGDSVKAA